MHARKAWYAHACEPERSHLQLLVILKEELEPAIRDIHSHVRALTHKHRRAPIV
jgi:hypothetical protein